MFNRNYRFILLTIAMIICITFLTLTNTKLRMKNARMENKNYTLILIVSEGKSGSTAYSELFNQARITKHTQITVTIRMNMYSICLNHCIVQDSKDMNINY